MSTSPTTKLEAVNTMLSTIGEAPVNSLATGLIDAETAETILNNVSREVQTRGWNFNTEYDYTFSPNVDGEIDLPANIIRADLAQSLQKYRTSNAEYIQRGSKIYDKSNHTYVIDKDLKLDVVVLLDYELLPEVARSYIALRASRIFQDRVVGDAGLSQLNRTDEAQALQDLKEAESDNGNYNIFDDYSTYRVLERSPSTEVDGNGSSF